MTNGMQVIGTWQALEYLHLSINFHKDHPRQEDPTLQMKTPVLQADSFAGCKEAETRSETECAL